MDDDFLSSEEDEELIVRLTVPRRYIRNVENPFEYFDSAQFKRRFRFSKECVQHMLFPMVENRLHNNYSNRGLPISKMEKLLIALRYYGSNCFQNISGDMREKSQPSVSRIVKEVSRCFAEQLQDHIFFPRTEQENQRNIQDFERISNFPNVVGVIDCTHILISNPGGPYGETFRNRKGWFSLNVQIVGGPNLEIMDIVVRHPGSAHDALIFDRSAVRTRFERREINGLLLGDSAYRNCSYLLTPIINPMNDMQMRYNTVHIRTRNLIERLFGVLKRRFPCIRSGLRTKLSTSSVTILAVAILYNIGIRSNQNVENYFHQVDTPDVDNHENEDANEYLGYNVENGLQFREQFIIQHFS